MAASTTPSPASVASSTGAKPGPKGPERMTGAQAIVRTLEDLGTDLVFGIPGGAVLPLYDALNRSETLRHVLTRHEQGAGHAAEGYAVATGKVGVYCHVRPWCHQLGDADCRCQLGLGAYRGHYWPGRFQPFGY